RRFPGPPTSRKADGNRSERPVAVAQERRYSAGFFVADDNIVFTIAIEVCNRQAIRIGVPIAGILIVRTRLEGSVSVVHINSQCVVVAIYADDFRFSVA